MLFHKKAPGVHREKVLTIIPVARMVLKILVANWLEAGVQIRPSFQTGKAHVGTSVDKTFFSSCSICVIFWKQQNAYLS